jgi:hypothetical protein
LRKIFFHPKNIVIKKVAVIVNVKDLTSRHYDQVWDGLRAAGLSRPQGLLSQVGFANPDGGWRVVDVWESKKAFDSFRKPLIPLIQKTGVNVPPPNVVPAHYFYQA